jgi:ribonuclease P protein component
VLNNQGFPPELRLKTQAEFSHTLQKRLRLFSPFYTIFYSPNGKNHSRIGFVISKRQVKKAHERNRLRRIAKEAFRLRQGEIFAWDLVIMASHQAITVENEELRRCIDGLLSKLPNSRDGFR